MGRVQARSFSGEARMKPKTKNLFRWLSWLTLDLIFLSSAVFAQQSSPSPDTKVADNNSSDTPVQAGDDAGNYTIISTLEFGYRGLRVVGDLNKYQSGPKSKQKATATSFFF